VLKRWHQASRLAQWFALSPVVVAACLGAGFGTNWSANGLAFAVALGLAYLAIPPMVTALISWQQQRDAATATASPSASGGLASGQNSPLKSDSYDTRAAAPERRQSPVPASPAWTPELTNVLRAISEHLDAGEDLESVRRKAGISRSRLRRAQIADNAWQFLLDQAMDEGLLDEVLAAAAAKSPQVAAAVDDYYRGQ